MNQIVNISQIRKQIAGKSLKDQLSHLASIFNGRILFTTSFGIEDQVITDIIFENNLPVKVITLDTGRLFPETYKVFSETIRKYQKKIDVYFPDHEAVEKMVTEKGPFSFYYSKENRIECCRYRKVVPLNRALENMDCWISGIRASQSDKRSRMEQLEYDDSKKLLKFYPLFDWTYEQVKSYIKEYGIPYNILHEKGFVSIGCEPCTRAVKEGEDFRAGRWWWETDGTKECGCHIK
jgi:phosphoadenosine phosphosulfate reductase